MSDDKMIPDEFMEETSQTIQSVHSELEALSKRLEAQDDISEEEMEIVALRAVQALEGINRQFAEMLGPFPEEEYRKRMKERKSPEEYEEFLKSREALLEHRRQKELGNG
jgi:hypothetical protein